MSNQQIATFGQAIGAARKRKNLYLKDCAALIKKEDGTPISLQYLSDLEKDRRGTPSEQIIKQLSSVLEIPLEVLYFYSNRFPPNIDKRATEEQIVSAFEAFFEKLGKGVAAK